MGSSLARALLDRLRAHRDTPYERPEEEVNIVGWIRPFAREL
jgi:hypothetical protein